MAYLLIRDLPDAELITSWTIETKIDNQALYMEYINIYDMHKNIKTNDIIVLGSKYSTFKTFCKVISISSLDNTINYSCNHLYQSQTNVKYNCFELLQNCRIFKFIGPTEQQILKKIDFINILKDFLYDATYLPVDNTNIKFIGEEYRNGRDIFYKDNYKLQIM
jgi:hypothetical protein